MRIVIVGLGKVGRNILKYLVEEQHDVVVIDKNAEKLQTLVDRFDVMGVCGNGCMAENLTEAGIDSADLLIAVTPSDEQNVLCCLVARSLGVKNTIARVRDPEYNSQSEFMREKFGIDRLVNPEEALADEITRILRFPSAKKIHAFADGRVEIVEMKLSEGSALVGKKLSELEFNGKQAPVLISAIERAGEVFIPNGSTVLESGDILSICAKHLEIRGFLKSYGLFKRKAQYVMILGADRRAYYLARNLEKFGFIVKIISPHREKCEQLHTKLNTTNVVCADFADTDVLVSEGLADADALVAMTGNLESNVMMSLFAKNKGVPKIITVVANDSYAGVLEGIDLDTVVSPNQVAAEEIVGYLRSISVPAESRIVALYRIADDQAEALQFNVNHHKELTGKSLKELSQKLRSGILITAIVRGADLIIPKGDTVIQGNDSVIIVTTAREGNPVFTLDDILR